MMPETPIGRVVLIGGGPGADDLITVRGLDRLMTADVVITDRLAPVGLLDRLGPDVEIIDAARAPGSRSLTYDEIVALMIDHARKGKNVVRLKGGDPFVFAHGAQEMTSCAAAGIQVEVVPGVTSATAGAVFARLPLTSTAGAAGFTVVSGHLHPDDPASRIDWTALSRSGTNLVVLMGMRHLDDIVARLLRDGVSGDADAACIADMSKPSQRVVRAPLAEFATAVRNAGLANPATVIISAVTRTARRRVLVLGGSRSGKSEFAEKIAQESAAVAYVATADGNLDDPEWTVRIARHRQRRAASWQTIETRELERILASDNKATLLIDSITTWLSGVLDEEGIWTRTDSSEIKQSITSRVDQLVQAWAASSSSAIMVSDEVGGGVVPATESGRIFRDILGELNQRLAATADEVWLVTAGIPQRLR